MEKSFFTVLSQYQAVIDISLRSFFDREIQNAKTPFSKNTLTILKEFSLRPAKRIRAILINYGYLLAGGKNKKEILKTSIFIELIHNFLLIHDDIIDREERRRGKATLHNQYKNKITSTKEEKEHYGLSMAITAGDMAEVLGRKILTQSNIPLKNKVKAMEGLDDVLVRTIYGEMFELELKMNLKNKKTISESDILEIYKNKTALYTFVGPLQIGGLLAGSNQLNLSFFEKIGMPLGIVFQIKDDLHDLFGNASEIGSKIASDIKEGQPNLLIIKTLKKPVGKLIKKYLGKKDLSKNDIKIIKKAVMESGAYNECLGLIDKLINETKKHIMASKYTKKDKLFFTNLADYIGERKN